MSKHIIIVGAGVIGQSTAYYAVQRGHRVTILDRSADCRESCSFGNAGMIVPSHFVPLAAPGMVALGLKWMWNPESPFYIKPRLDGDLLSWGWKFFRAANATNVAQASPVLRDMHMESRKCFEELADIRGNDFGLVKKGLLMLCNTEHGLEEEAKGAETARRLGVPADVLDAKQTAALDPNVRMSITGSVHYPKDCHLTPGLFLTGLKDLLDRSGVHFLWNTTVTGWNLKGQQIHAVKTSSGETSGDEYMICGGSWSPVIARELGLNLPMQAGKGYSVTLPNPRQLPEICAIFTEARVAVTPMGKSLRIGGTMEIAGLDESINPVRVRGFIKSVPKYYPDFRVDDFRDLPVWRGLRPCSPDGLPYIGRTSRYSNLTIATGHSMMGLSLGPVTGKMCAAILSNEKSPISTDLLSPDRYN